MGLFGGDSKSESAQSSAATQTQVGDPQAINIGKSKYLSLNITDGGAVRQAFQFGGNALVAADRQLNRSTGLLREQTKSTERLAGRQLTSSERLANRYLFETANAAGDIVGLADSGLDFARDALKTSERQGQVVAGAVSELAGSFQEFVNRENNPGERVNLYLILGAASVAALYFLRS